MLRDIGRRLLLSALTAPALAACASPLPRLEHAATTPDALALLATSAAAHGATAYADIADVSVRYTGQWHGIVGTLQPALVDRGFRGGSEERLLLRDGIAAQSYAGPQGHKEVVRRTGAGSQGEVTVWFNGEEAHDDERRTAAALVADGYTLFLLGPMLLSRQWATERSLVMERSGAERIELDGQDHDCEVLRVRMTPGLGLSASDRLTLFIDRESRLMRRVRFTLEGMDSTQGAVAQVDTFDHVAIGGVLWPTRFHEHLLRPLPLPVHDWRATGLDLNRGLVAADVDGPTFDAKAAVPAMRLATAAKVNNG